MANLFDDMEWNICITPTSESYPLFASGDHAHNSIKGHILTCIIHAIGKCLTNIYYHIAKISCVSTSDPIDIVSEYSLCYTIQKDKPLTSYTRPILYQRFHKKSRAQNFTYCCPLQKRLFFQRS